MSTLANLITDLASGKIKVVDLTQPLEPDTPVIALPEMFAPSPGLSITEISRYDDAGPGWYWNTLTLGEHTGTHFDAPVHWISGKDFENNTTDTIPASKLVAPANVIDVSKEVAADEGFLLTPEHIDKWEEAHGAIEAGSWVLLRSDWSKRQGAAFLNLKEDGPASPGPSPEAVKALVKRDVLGFGTENRRHRRGRGGRLRPGVSRAHAVSRSWQVRTGELGELRPTAAQGGAPHHAAAQARQRLG